MSGPLAGFRIVEVSGIGPGPFAGMVLAGLGAEVLRVDRTSAVDPTSNRYDVLVRSRRSVAVDLKHPDGPETVLRLVEQADAVFEGFRPGVAERLGIGPDVCLARNPRLVYGRMTGWGQDGPLAAEAGHDIGYLSVAGALAHIGRAGELPTPPLNLVADFGGGGMLLVVGMLAALLHARATGEGQVVDAAMVDGAALLMAPFYAADAIGFWSEERGTNLLDSGAPYYDVYRCADGGELALGAIEPQFFAALLDGLGLDASTLPDQRDRDGWPTLRARFTEVIATRTRDEWVERFAGKDACVAPVLTMREAAQHPHVTERGTLVEVEGVTQPAPAPRFSVTATDAPTVGSAPGADTDTALQEWGFGPDEVEQLRAAGALA